MRTEATLEQWRRLYQAATMLGEYKPWEKFWDMDLIGIQNGEEEDTVFFSILGRGGDCYGITVYEGYEGLNDFLMLTMHEDMNLSPEYAMYSQNNLTCYWGNREELTEKQRKTIKDLGYKYRGKNKWLYFLSFKTGYFPYNLDQEEVLRMTEHLENLNLALKCYDEAEVKVDFSKGNMFLFQFLDDKKAWSFGEAPLPFTAFQYGSLIITDDELLKELASVPRCNMTIEVDIMPLGAAVNDKKYDRPANPSLCILADAKSGMMLHFGMNEPGEDVIASMAEELLGFIFEYGAPKEIRVTNVILEAGLEQISKACGTNLRRVRRLPGIGEFLEEMKGGIL